MYIVLPEVNLMIIGMSLFQNLPHDAYKLLAVPSPIGGVLVISANMIYYHSQVAFHCLGMSWSSIFL